ncbi:hypothetical protein VNO77_41905 [Canavalia gladiata]|uniref:Uncharacterized protein n=1 Tax=Canavalia gladiata TaxID=3824 RepID=A0AAN9K0M8_CANGL
MRSALITVLHIGISKVESLYWFRINIVLAFTCESGQAQVYKVLISELNYPGSSLYANNQLPNLMHGQGACMRFAYFT